MFKQLKFANFIFRAVVASAVLVALSWCVSANAVAIEREIAWTEDYESAIQRAASTNSVILLHFYGDYCPPCKLLDKKTFHDPALVSTMNEHLVTVKINADRRRDLAQKYQVTRWPTDVYLFPNGDEIYRGVSNADPAVYCKTIERVALRHRDWTVERNSMAKIKEKRQDRAIAAHTPQIKTEPQANTGNVGRAVKTQEAAFTNPSELPKVVQSHERPTARATSRVIDNPYLAQTPIIVPPAVNTPPTVTPGPVPNAYLPPVSVPLNASSPAPSVVPQVSNSHTTVQPTAAPIVTTRPPENARADRTQTDNAQTEQSFPSMLRESQASPAIASPTTKRVEAQPASAPRESNLRNASNSSEVAKQPSSPQSVTTNRQVYIETIGLGGFCPVTLIESLSQPNPISWVEGKKSCAVRHRGRVYYCASERARQTLLSDPDKYTPCLSGFDIVTLCNDGVLHDGKCEFGCIQEGTNRVFLFENKANYDAFSKNSAYYSRLLDNSAPERVANELNGTQLR